MSLKTLPSQSELLSLLEYRPNTGQLVWRARTEKNCCRPKWFNSRFANRDAFTAINRKGYHFGLINSQAYLAHRVIWRMATGDDPLDQNIDHINGVKSDNRWSNLRLATNSQNQANKERGCRRSSSKYKGVSYAKGQDRWQSYLRQNGRKIHLGTHQCQTAAALCYDRAAIDKFGEYALTNMMIDERRAANG